MREKARLGHPPLAVPPRRRRDAGETASRHSVDLSPWDGRLGKMLLCHLQITLQLITETFLCFAFFFALL